MRIGGACEKIHSFLPGRTEDCEIKFLGTEWSCFEFKMDTLLREQGKCTSL